ncbi:uncharacterized protein LOC126816055 isoform X2 [Patella vulgata]|uniref:uncharacterized protein LOC126816055 isoform X2 n=1 Tax=Patella vulgata TaxID=6465 RepID=UPI00217FC4EE|nr:uncharacterized protein LOC126816055 isoform X2 [Patella vulgata]
MNEAAASNFINSLVRNLQVLCHSNVEFRNDIEVVGHLYLKVDKAKKFNYIVDEKVCKNDASSTMFVSNSYHSVNTAQKKKDEQQGENTSKSTSETGENTNNEQARLNPPKPDSQPGMSPMSTGTPDIYKTPTKRGLRSPDGGHGRKHPRLSSDGTSHQSFSFSLQRDRESPLKKDRSGSFSASQDSSSSHSFKDNFKNDSVEIDLTNIKEEVDDKSAIQASCFFSQEQQHQMLEQSSVHSFSNQSKDSSTGEETLGLYPIALHQNENQNLDSLAHLSSSVAGGSQGASFGQSPQQMPQFLSVNKSFEKEEQHIQILTDETDEGQAKSTILKCSICNYTSKRKWNLIRHIRGRHSVLEVFICPVDGCGERFTMMYEFKLHIDSHTELT